MGHHGNDPRAMELDRLEQEALLKAYNEGLAGAAAKMEELTKDQKLGATGQFPMGHLNANDEGEIRMAVGVEKGKVVINFGKPVAWFGMDPEQAKIFAQSILAKRAEILRQ